MSVEQKTRASNSEAAKDRHSEKTEQRRGHNLAAQSEKKKKNLQPKKRLIIILHAWKEHRNGC